MMRLLNRRRRVRALAVLTTLAAIAQAALASGYFHRTWQSEEGLPQNSAQAVVQSRDGYLWVGTQDGLARFDGARFTVFNRHNTPAIRVRSVTALIEDSGGTLWAGTDAGGVCFFRNGEFAVAGHPYLENAVIRAFHQTRDGALWIGSTNGLVRYQDGGFDRFTTEDGLPGDSIRSLLEDDRGDFWVGTGHGVARFAGGAISPGNVTVYLPGIFVIALLQSRDGDVWIGSTLGLRRHRHGNVRLDAFDRRHGLSDNRISAFYEDSEGTLWVGTFNGLNQRRSDGRFVEITDAGAPYDLIYSIVEDREGNVWAGTKDGLNQLSPRVFTAHTRQHGLTEHAVVSVLEDRKGTVWIGTWGGGLNYLRDGELKVLPDVGDRGLVLGLHEGRDGSLWIGNDYHGGLFQKKDGAVRRYGEAEGVLDQALTVIHEDRSENLWVGAVTGLSLFRDGKVQRRFTVEDGLPDNRIRAIRETRAGDLWIATDGGLARWSEGGFENLTAEHGLPHNSVLSVFEDSEDQIWVTTEAGGLARLANGRFISLTGSDGVLGERLFHVLEDDLGYFWMSSRRGIFRVSKSQLRSFEAGRAESLVFDTFGKMDGLASLRCNGVGQPSGWKSRDGRLWFPTIKGVAVADPAKVRRNELPPPVRIEDILVRREPVVIGAKLRLPLRRDDVEIHYTALSFQRPELIRFQYMLEGFDNQWIDAGARRVAFYNNLPPGKYRFLVKACNDLGIWNEEGAALAFALPPAFYQTYWFYVLGLALAGLAVLAGHRWRVRRIRQREQELVRLVDDRTGELQESVRSLESFCYTIAHDLRAPLRAMQGLTTALEEDYGQLMDDTGRDYARRITAASLRMDKMIQDLLDYGRLSHMEIELGSVDLNKSVDDVLGDLREEIQSAGASIRLDRPLPAVRANPIVLNQILSNLISNALKFVAPGVKPHLHIRTSESRDAIRLWIKDNGIGIDPRHQGRIFKVFERLNPSTRYSGTGIGLAIVQKGVERMNGRIGVDSQRGKGAAFWIELKKSPWPRNP